MSTLVFTEVFLPRVFVELGPGFLQDFIASLVYSILSNVLIN